jgi:ATP-dependent DNA helicase RecG
MRTEGYSASELFRQLNETDERESLEAKALSDDSAHSIMETVCSFSNEPGLGGGVILLGVAENQGEGARYVVEGVADVDKAQLDFASQCSSMFNFPVRPEIEVEQVDGKNLLKIFVPELPSGRKPLYFKKDGIPKGIWRRIGSSDQRCSEEELSVFYNREEACDGLPVDGVSIEDVDEDAVSRYRFLRGKVNSEAEELSFDTPKLLKALGCVNRRDPRQLNVAGLMMFGNAATLRALYPAARVDYIRVPGTEWVSDPARSFVTTELRGPLISLVYRAIDAIRGDLPSGFLLLEDDIQAKSTGLPLRALREAIVNALMHRSYRANRPTQIIRYDNRIEIVNAGYSLKPEEELGEPGSEIRNPLIADIFHEINLAEEKGSGIRRMRIMMADAHLTAPTFESNRSANTFTIRLLLHHFLGEDDLKWLSGFERYGLDDNQQKALIFLREAGAVNNSVFRQLSGADTLRASSALREMRDMGIIEQKGRGNATYYVFCEVFSHGKNQVSQDNRSSLQDNRPRLQDNGPRLQDNWLSLQDKARVETALKQLKQRLKSDVLCGIIVDLCRIKSFECFELAKLVQRDETYLRTILSKLVKSGRLRMKFPEMPNHPQQAYMTP